PAGKVIAKVVEGSPKPAERAIPSQLVARNNAHFEILEGQPLRLGPDIMTSCVFTHAKLQQRHGVAFPPALRGLAITTPIDVIIDPPRLKLALQVLGISGLV